MAIKIDLQNSQFGIPFAGAYFRIVRAEVSRTRRPESRHSVMIDVAGYAQKPGNDDTKEVDFRRYHVPLVDCTLDGESYVGVESFPGTVFLERCYAWVMAQPDMQGCQAV